jgi:two-component system KDP operon response regulator KdpE
MHAVGYDVISALTGEKAVEMAAMEQPDLLLLDVMFPGGIDGYETCRRIRQFSDIPVIMLTAKSQENDTLRGFEAGADDYLPKPFSSRELVARVRAVLKRSRHTNEKITASLICDDLEINFARHSVKLKGEEIKLTPTEYSLLHQLALNPNCVLLHRDLLVNVWGQEYGDDIDYLRAYIRRLRIKLKEDNANPKYIITLPGTGYMFNCPGE